MAATRADHPLSLRIKPDELAEIDKRADSAGLSRTQYMVRASLGLISNPMDADSRLDRVEERLDRLEERANLGAY